MKKIIHCITNDVTKNDVANILLALNSSPIMAHHPEEVAEVQKFSSALLLNLGATFDYDVMQEAVRTANEQGHAVVLDPVGVSGITFRRTFAMRLISGNKISCIRGNRAEIWALINDCRSGDGLDSVKEGIPEDNELLNAMTHYSKEHDIILVASGASDIITSAKNYYICNRGHEMMTRVTGMGCMSSAVIASHIANAANLDISEFEAVCNAVRSVGEAGEKAAELTVSKDGGTMTFKMLFIDEMSKANAL